MQRKSSKSDHVGKFVTVDLQAEVAWIANTAEHAVLLALDENPHGTFQLIQVGETVQ